MTTSITNQRRARSRSHNGPVTYTHQNIITAFIATEGPTWTALDILAGIIVVVFFVAFVIAVGNGPY